MMIFAFLEHHLRCVKRLGGMFLLLMVLWCLMSWYGAENPQQYNG